MAQRRMFKLDMILSDFFMQLPDNVQLAYYRLCAMADDEGFITNPRMVCYRKKPLDILEDIGYIFRFKSGIVLIRHWNVHNKIRKDSFQKSSCTAEKALVILNSDGIYEWKSVTKTVQDSENPVPQESIGKDSLGKDSLGKESSVQESEGKDSLGQDSAAKESAGTAAMVAASGGAPTETDMEKNFLLFWEAYPKKMDEAATRQVFMETREDFDVIMEGLEHHKNCNQWVSDNGCFIPDPKNWLKRQGWKYRPPLYKPKAAPSPPVLYGGTGQLGPEELAAIQRTLAEG